MSRQIVQPNNNHMKRMGAASIQTMLYAAAGETVEKHRVENTTVHKWCNMHLAPTDNNEASRSQTWYVDSGTSNHITGHKEWFERLEKIERSSHAEWATTRHTLLSTSNRCFNEQKRKLMARGRRGRMFILDVDHNVRTKQFANRHRPVTQMGRPHQQIDIEHNIAKECGEQAPEVQAH